MGDKEHEHPEIWEDASPFRNNPGSIIERLCKLQEYIFNNAVDYEGVFAADCFCGRGGFYGKKLKLKIELMDPDKMYRNSGMALKRIVLSTESLIDIPIDDFPKITAALAAVKRVEELIKDYKDGHIQWYADFVSKLEAAIKEDGK